MMIIIAFGGGRLGADVGPERLENRKRIQFSIFSETVNAFHPPKGVTCSEFCLSLITSKKCKSTSNLSLRHFGQSVLSFASAASDNRSKLRRLKLSDYRDEGGNGITAVGITEAEFPGQFVAIVAARQNRGYRRGEDECLSETVCGRSQ